MAAERWPGVESALALYDHLGATCLKAYERENVTFRLARSCASKSCPQDIQATLRHHQTFDSPAAIGFSSFTYNDDGSSSRSYLLQSDRRTVQQTYSSSGRSENTFSESGKSDTSRSNTLQLPTFTTPFDETLAYNTFPAKLSDLRPWALAAQQVPERFLGFIGDQHLQYFHAPYGHHQPIRQLSQEEQLELMINLETNGLYGGTQNVSGQLRTYFQGPQYGI